MYALYWLIAVAVFLLIEIITLGLTSIWFAGGALVSCIAAALGMPLILQFVIFVVVSCVLFAITRPIAKKFFNSKVEKTNSEALIGEHGKVTESIDNKNEVGTVHISGLDWTARSLHGDKIAKGSEVVVHEIQGVKLIVTQVEEEKDEKREIKKDVKVEKKIEKDEKIEVEKEAKKEVEKETEKEAEKEVEKEAEKETEKEVEEEAEKEIEKEEK